MNKSFINKRKKNYFNINFYLIILFFFVIFFGLCFAIKYKEIVKLSSKFIEKYSKEYDYILTNIDISKLNYLDDQEILLHFKEFIDKSIFLIPINKISKDINKNKWIKSVNIKNNHKNTLTLLIEEEIPFGIFNNNSQRILFSSNLVFLDILENDNLELNLINFFGKNSIMNSKQIILTLDQNFIENISEAIFIENRRWNLKLKNSILLKLPEINPSAAIDNYKKIYSNFSNKDLKAIESIDLRIKNKAIIKYINNL